MCALTHTNYTIWDGSHKRDYHTMTDSGRKSRYGDGRAGGTSTNDCATPTCIDTLTMAVLGSSPYDSEIDRNSFKLTQAAPAAGSRLTRFIIGSLRSSPSPEPHRNRAIFKH